MRGRFPKYDKLWIISLGKIMNEFIKVKRELGLMEGFNLVVKDLLTHF